MNMKKDTRWISFTGVGALALLFVTGCTGADQTGDGQTADSPDAAKMEKGVNKMVEGGKEAGGAAAKAVAKGGESVANAASKGGETVANAASKAGAGAANAASKANDALSNAAAKAGQATTNAASKAAAAAKNLDDAAIVTPKVKAQIMANASMKGSDLDVNTTDKNLSLEGTVKSEAQKTLAGNIAKANAPGYVIKNNLKVAY